MAYNNPSLYNAAVIGLSGAGIDERWLINSDPNSYVSYRVSTEVIANAIDNSIPPISNDPTQERIGLLQSICSSVFGSRYPIIFNQDTGKPIDFTSIGKNIAAIFNQITNGSTQCL